MSDVKIDIESYCENGVQGSVKILADVFNMAASFAPSGSMGADTQDNIEAVVNGASDLIKKMSPNMQAISLFQDDQTYLMLQFMKIAMPLIERWQFNNNPDGFQNEIIEQATNIFEGAEQKNLIKRAPTGFECR